MSDVTTQPDKVARIRTGTGIRNLVNMVIGSG